MSVFNWFRRKPPSPSPDPAPVAVVQPEPPAPEIVQLGTLAGQGAESEAQALQLLDRLANTRLESEAIRTVFEAVQRGQGTGAIRYACARLLAARGDRNAAIQMLGTAESSEAVLFGADLLFESGQVGRAIAEVQRVLARDIQWPGALERHKRWKAALGLPQERDAIDPGATVSLPSQPGGPFRIVREVARGGAGTIYEARDDTLQRTIAFKLYHRAREDRDQIEREARMAVKLAGPGVIAIIDASFDEGWIGLEWAALGSLRDLFAAGRMSELLPLHRWVVPLARALERVHAAGLVHADFKPANILLRDRSSPVVSDFGIAVAAGANSLGGSRGYLSPERVDGSPLTPSDDIYGFGRVLEDVILAAGDTNPDRRAWERVTHRCLEPATSRPRDACALLELFPCT